MTKPKTLDQLRAEKERAETQLAQEKHKLERLGSRQDLCAKLFADSGRPEVSRQ